MGHRKGSGDVNAPETGITGKRRSSSLRIIVAFIILALAAVSIAGIYFMVKYGQRFTSINSVQPEPHPLSCLEIKSKGINSSTYYIIQPTGSAAPFMTYCDMETDGGGWTLVAAVHEANINKKCAKDDVWFSNSSAAASPTRMWENLVTFNSADSSTTNDYKNAGYSELNASDVMIRHVPNGAAVSESKQAATLEYFSKNEFLKNYGGNLQSLYADHFPLTPAKDSTDVLGPSVIEDMLDSLAKASDAGGILNTTFPPSMYKYTYDDVVNDRLTDDENNLFNPYGMQITARAPNCDPVDLEYGRNYTCPDVSSRKSYPFFALMKTDNITTPHQYQYVVTSLRSNSDDQVVNDYKTYLFEDKLLMDYYYSCKYSDIVPSYCDVWFTVYSPWLWESKRVTVDSSILFPHTTASHSNAVYGYTMIAREPPSRVDYEFPYESFLRRVLKVIASFKERDISGMLDALEKEGANILNTTIPEYYQYTYDNISSSRLSNGGRGMFSPYGMEVALETLNPPSRKILNYGESYLLRDHSVQVSSRKSHPFFALAKNDKSSQIIGFSFSQGRPKSDYFVPNRYSGEDLKIGNFEMRYQSDCRYNEFLSSICNVVFEVYNRKDWNSGFKTISEFSSKSTEKNISGTLYPFVEKSVFGRYANSIVGYTLFARQLGNVYSPFRLTEIMHNILQIIARYPIIASSCANSSANLAVPIRYSVGTTRSVFSFVPSNFRRSVTTGHMQFRAYGYSGNVYAFCPAVSVETCDSKFVCVGGVGRSSETTDDCSDFLDWADTETSNASTVSEDMNGNRHSTANIQSAILMFYR